MSFQVTWKDKGCIFNFSGKVTTQEIEEASNLWTGDSRVDGHTYSIFNFAEADLSPVTEDVALEQASISWAASLSKPVLKLAFVAQEGNAVELIRHYIKSTKDMGSTWDLNIFPSLEEAVAWVKT